MLASGERCHRAALRNREVGQDRRGGRGDRIPVPSRIGDNDQHVLQATIAELEHDPAYLGLAVDQTRFGLDRKQRRDTTEGVDHRVPSSLITRDREWDLGAKAQIGMKSRTKATEYCDLPCIKERIRTGIGRNTDVESDGGPDSRQLVDAHAGQGASLDPPHLRR